MQRKNVEAHLWILGRVGSVRGDEVHEAVRAVKFQFEAVRSALKVEFRRPLTAGGSAETSVTFAPQTVAGSHYSELPGFFFGRATISGGFQSRLYFSHAMRLVEFACKSVGYVVVVCELAFGEKRCVILFGPIVKRMSEGYVFGEFFQNLSPEGSQLRKGDEKVLGEVSDGRGGENGVAHLGQSFPVCFGLWLSGRLGFRFGKE